MHVQHAYRCADGVLHYTDQHVLTNRPCIRRRLFAGGSSSSLLMLHIAITLFTTIFLSRVSFWERSHAIFTVCSCPVILNGNFELRSSCPSRKAHLNFAVPREEFADSFRLFIQQPSSVPHLATYTECVLYFQHRIVHKRGPPRLIFLFLNSRTVVLRSIVPCKFRFILQ